jgi:hypothetical protein
VKAAAGAAPFNQTGVQISETQPEPDHEVHSVVGDGIAVGDKFVLFFGDD